MITIYSSVDVYLRVVVQDTYPKQTNEDSLLRNNSESSDQLPK